MKKFILIPLMLLGLSGCVWYGPGGWDHHGHHDEGHGPGPGGGYGHEQNGGWH